MVAVVVAMVVAMVVAVVLRVRVVVILAVEVVIGTMERMKTILEETTIFAMLRMPEAAAEEPLRCECPDQKMNTTTIHLDL